VANQAAEFLPKSVLIEVYDVRRGLGEYVAVNNPIRQAVATRLKCRRGWILSSPIDMPRILAKNLFEMANCNVMGIT
jgi:hypothetical protein